MFLLLQNSAEWTFLLKLSSEYLRYAPVCSEAVLNMCFA